MTSREWWKSILIQKGKGGEKNISFPKTDTTFAKSINGILGYNKGKTPHRPLVPWEVTL